MSILGNLHVKKGSKKKRKRVGRGEGSGHGKTSCRGHKGQLARSGGGKGPGFEGGQTPLQRRLPKKGFISPNKIEYQVINVSDLGCFKPGEVVDVISLQKSGLIKSNKIPVKILGDGELEINVIVKANKFSIAAKEKIEKAGGKAEEMSSGINV